MLNFQTSGFVKPNKNLVCGKSQFGFSVKSQNLCLQNRSVYKTTDLNLEKTSLPFFNRSFDKKRLKLLFSWYYAHKGENAAFSLVETLQKLGFTHAMKAGISLGIDDLKVPPSKNKSITEAVESLNTTKVSVHSGNVMALEEYQQFVDTWHRTSENLKTSVVQNFARGSFNINSVGLSKLKKTPREITNSDFDKSNLKGSLIDNKPEQVLENNVVNKGLDITFQNRHRFSNNKSLSPLLQKKQTIHQQKNLNCDFGYPLNVNSAGYKSNLKGIQDHYKTDKRYPTTSINFQPLYKCYGNTLNPVYMMAFSGARGNLSQVRQLVGMRGLMADPQGQLVEFPIQSNFREGLTVTEYMISCYGARKGLVDTALRTAAAGYLTRRLVDVAHHQIVRFVTCGTKSGIWLSSQMNKKTQQSQDVVLPATWKVPLKKSNEFAIGPTDKQNVQYLTNTDSTLISKNGYGYYRNIKTNPTQIQLLNRSAEGEVNLGSQNRVKRDLEKSQLNNQGRNYKVLNKEFTQVKTPLTSAITRCVGRVLARDIPGIGFRNQEINISLGSLAVLREIYDTVGIYIRSPLTCQAETGICQLCYGWSVSANRLVGLGEAVGIIAAQSIGEPGTQLTMRTFHTGGVFSGDIMEECRAKHGGYVVFHAPYLGLMVRTAGGAIAFCIKTSGVLSIKDKNAFTTYNLSPNSLLFVRQGETVSTNSLLAQIPNLPEIEENAGESTKTIASSFSGEIRQTKTINDSLENIRILAGQQTLPLYASSFNIFPISILRKNPIPTITSKYTGKDIKFEQNCNKWQSRIAKSKQPQPNYLKSQTVFATDILQDNGLNGFYKPQYTNFASISKNSKFSTFVGQAKAKTRVIEQTLSRTKPQVQANAPNTFDEKNLLLFSFKHAAYMFPGAHRLGNKIKTSSKQYENNFLSLNSQLGSVKQSLFKQTLQTKGINLASNDFFNLSFSINSKSGLKTAFLKNSYSSVSKLQNLNTLNTEFSRVLPLFLVRQTNFSFLYNQIKSLLEKNNILKKKNGDFVLDAFFNFNSIHHLNDSNSAGYKSNLKGIQDHNRKFKGIGYNKSNLKGIQYHSTLIKSLPYPQIEHIYCFSNFSSNKNNTKFATFNSAKPISKSFKNKYVYADLGSKRLLAKNKLFFTDKSTIKNRVHQMHPIAMPLIDNFKYFRGFPTSQDKVKTVLIDGLQKSDLIKILNFVPFLEFKRYAYLFWTKEFIFFIKSYQAHTVLTGKYKKIKNQITNSNFVQNNLVFSQLQSRINRRHKIFNFLRSCETLQNKLQKPKTQIQKQLASSTDLKNENKTKLKYPIFNYLGKNIYNFGASKAIKDNCKEKDQQHSFLRSVKPYLLNKIFCNVMSENCFTKSGEIFPIQGNTNIQDFKQNYCSKTGPANLRSGLLTHCDRVSYKILPDQSTTVSEKISKETVFPVRLKVGDFINTGDELFKNYGSAVCGQIIEKSRSGLTLRFTQNILYSNLKFRPATVSPNVQNGNWLGKGTPLVTLPYISSVTGDIVAGIPKIEQLFEARGEALEETVNNIWHSYNSLIVPKTKAVRECFKEIGLFVVAAIQKVYSSQGVHIADKHLEVIVRQMTKRVLIINPGDTEFLADEFVDLNTIECVNWTTYGEAASYTPHLIGITKVSLTNNSFLSAASFQQTARVLERETFLEKTDRLLGLKERVMMGALIDAGTGSLRTDVFLSRVTKKPLPSEAKNLFKNLNFFSRRTIEQSKKKL